MKNIFMIFISGALIIFMTLRLSQKSDQYDPNTQRKLLYPPPHALKYFTFGYNDTLADTYWIRLLQDFSECEQHRGGSPLNPEGAKRGKNRTPTCSMGWAYHMLDLIMEISPRFTAPAETGPTMLSVVVDDIDGASAIYDKAMKNFPNNWQIFYYAGSHFLTEVEDTEKALHAFQHAYELGAPAWLPLLIARLNTKQGRDEMARKILLEFIEKVKDRDDYRQRAEEKLRELSK